MYLIDANTQEFIIGFYVSNNIIPQSGDLIRMNDDNYKVEKRLFEVKLDGAKKIRDVRFSLLVEKEGGKE